MKVYVVTRHMSFRNGTSNSWPVGSFRDKDEAIGEATKHNEKMLEAIALPFAKADLQKFLGYLGIVSIDHDVLEMDVQDALIEVPRVKLQ